MDEIINGLNKEQREAVTYGDGPLLIIAGAGSGKTRVLTRRVAYLIKEKDVNPWNIAAITFTNKAAKEMKSRIEELVGEGAENIWAGTFHAMCARILRKEIDKLGYTRDFVIFDTGDSKTVIKECIKELNLDDKMYGDKYLLSEISKAKMEMIDEERFSNMYASDFRMSKVASAYDLYQKKLKRDNAVDFDDIINNTVKILKGFPETLDYYQDKFKYVLVDEYQDTNKVQDMLINLLSGKYKNICVVGDDQQSIYKFRGADILNILNFEKTFPGTKVIKLEQNYRSTQSILNVANGIIKQNKGNVEKKLWTENDEGNKPVFRQTDNEYDEANYVVSQINSLKINEYYKYSDFAVLYRTNAQSRALEDILLREGIPYKVIGGQKFYERKEIKDIVAYLRLVQNSNDNLSFKRVINEPKRGIGKTTIDKMEECANVHNVSMFEIASNIDKYDITRANVAIKSFTDMINRLKTETSSIEKLTTTILKESGYMKALEDEKTTDAESRIENLNEFLNVVIEFESQFAENGLAEFLENLSLVTDLDSMNDTDDSITLMTLHSAKGLEFPVVFMVGMEDGLFPSFRSIGQEDDLEEERRLCYVGTTRAKEHLYYTCAKSRTMFGSTSYTMVSRFIKEIPKHLIEGVELEKDKFGGELPEYIPKQKMDKKIDNAFNFRTAESFLKKIQQNDEVDLSVFREGLRVAHKKFGEGIITKVEPEDDDLKLDIQFEKSGMKRLMAKFAGLEVLDE